MTDHGTDDVHEMLDRYGEAWNAHDLDGVMALHTEDTVFHMHAGAEAQLAGDQQSAAP